ncbi:Formamidopyrimidine-DNA glycosylase H2TH domain-containing protein [Hysterangium stoloniferum]|nr:Formamidopyrimidine-DNA glycosylase H2TH domain-containing protein [Hysterangium stoloniferum]
MPELPGEHGYSSICSLTRSSLEVERAVRLIRQVAKNRAIEHVETTEDKIVYSGTTHDQFAKAIAGRTVIDAGRYGKVFYINLSGEGSSPVLHLGMTGMLQVKGQEPTYYRQKPRELEAWPPRFMKFILHIAPTATEPASQLAFLDPRRLGRIRLCNSPLTEPPISTLGFDPLLSMPPLEEFSLAVRKRACSIKALLLDQSFSAGIGNWLADEILYQAHVHPEQYANHVNDTQMSDLHTKMVEICRKAVDVNADSSQFPDNWLFKHRWGKGKKMNQSTLLLPGGGTATIKWIKVGGRTSAFVPELQTLPGKIASKMVTTALSMRFSSNVVNHIFFFFF